jgi:hypothetical protein
VLRFVCFEERGTRTEKYLTVEKFMAFKLKPDDDQVWEPSGVTQLAAHLIYLVKVVAIQLCNHPDHWDEFDFDMLGEIFKNYRSTPFASIRTVFAEAKIIFKDVSKLKLFIPGDNRDEVNIDGCPFSVDLLRRSYVAIKEKLVELQAELFFHRNVELNVDLLADNVSDNSDKATIKFKTDDLGHSAERLILRHIYQVEGLKSAFIVPSSNGATRFNVDAVENYLRSYNKFSDYLLAAIHISSGMPARGTELAAHLVRNIPMAHRNVNLAHGKVFLFPRYIYCLLYF